MRSIRMWCIAAVAVVIAGCGSSAPSGPGEAVEEFTHLHGLDIAPWAPDTVYVSTHQGLFSIDETGDWASVSEVAHDFMGFAANPTDRDILYSSGHPGSGSDLANPIGFMVSEDAGATWTPRSLEGQVDFHTMAVQPTDGNVVYGWFQPGGGLHRSTDAGQTWQTTAAQPVADADGALSIAVHATDPDHLYIGTPTRLLESRDGGATWTSLLDAPTTAVLTDPANPDRLIAYAATQTQGLIETRDGGDTWTQLGLVLEDDAVGHLALQPGDPDTILAGTFGEALYRTVDAGDTWETLAEDGRPTAE